MERTLGSDKENQEQGRMRVGGQVYDCFFILLPSNYYYAIFMLQTLMWIRNKQLCANNSAVFLRGSW